MTKKKYIEREVELCFGEEWEVIKLDEHRYYRRLSGHGLKAVDFIAVHKDFGVVFIEMKNYTNRKTSIPIDLDETMSDKLVDSKRLISIINKYYHRQWYFKLIEWLRLQWLFPEEWNLWQQANRHVERGNFFFLGIIDH